MNKSAGCGCGWCSGEVPGARHLKIVKGGGELFTLCHTSLDKGCATEWKEAVKAAAIKICSIFGNACKEVKDLVALIKKEHFHDQVAGLAYRLCELIRSKAAQLEQLLGEKHVELRKEFFFLMSNLLKHPKKMAYI